MGKVAVGRVGGMKGTGEGVPVLMYHGVSPSGVDDPSSVHVGLEAFTEQMAFLAAAGYRTADMNTLKGGVRPGEKTVVITFDDGFSSQHKYAMPVMRKHGFTGVVFLTTAFVGRNAAGPEEGVSCPGGPGGDGFMSWEEAIEMKDEGWSLQSHARTHRRMGLLPDGEIYAELADSKAQIESRSGIPVVALAYPHGNYSGQVIRAAAALGYGMAFSVHPGLARGSSPIMRLPRITVRGSDDLETFSRKVTTGYEDRRQRARALLNGVLFRSVGVKDFLSRAFPGRIN